MPDDAPVSLKGRIVRRLGKDKYLFRDHTGGITVEIDHDVWRDQSVGLEDTVGIQGESIKNGCRFTLMRIPALKCSHIHTGMP